MAMSGLGCEKPSVSARWAILLVLSINGGRKHSSHFVWPPVLAFEADFSSRVAQDCL